MKINHYERKSYININSNDRVKNNIIPTTNNKNIYYTILIFCVL